MMLFKKNRKRHWERVYRTHSSTEVGWYQAYPDISLKLIHKTCSRTDCKIIDVGGGTSKLSQYLIDQGYQELTILDISGKSINKAKAQLGEKSNDINWIEADVTGHCFNEQYDIWHDRAVFHFLTKDEERKRYISSLNHALRLNGHLIIATFSMEGPPKCSGLSVARYNPETLQKELGDNFNLVESSIEEHKTPSGVTQNFIYCRFIRQG
jgi:2-polyprenyl-3-methyl-5-hydroxy-6-metoxy-1,4-benzoquinol methylase